MPFSVTKITSEKEQRTAMKELKDYVLSVAAEAAPNNVLDVVVELDHGWCGIEKPIVFSTDENPELANIRLTIKAKPSMRPFLTTIRGIWGSQFTPVEGTPYYKYQFEKNEAGEYPKMYDLYCDRKRMKMASSPVWANPFPLTPEQRAGEEACDGLYVPLSIAKKLKEDGIHATQLRMIVQWEHYIMNVKDVDLDKTADVAGETYALVTFGEEFDEYFVRSMARANNSGKRATYFVNSTAFLTKPDTFVYDWHTGTIYVVPSDPAKMAKFSFAYTEQTNFFTFKGMKNVTVEGLTFTGLTSPYVCETGYYAKLSNNEKRAGRLRHAAILTSDVRNLVIRNCVFEGLGGNGVMLCDRTVNAEITGCVFKDIAMGGVVIGNYRPCDPWSEAQAWDNPANRVYNVRVVNNYFERIAYDYPNTDCIFLGHCDTAKISHNTIRGCGYSGIAAGDGYSPVDYTLGERTNMRNVEICYNDICDFMEVCNDGGGIYVTGANCTVDYAPRFNCIHHNYFTLNKNDRTEYYETFDAKAYAVHVDTYRQACYLDGCASNWEVHDLVIGCDLPVPLFTQYGVSCQYTHHNRVWNIFSISPISMENHRPIHDTLLGFHAMEKDLSALYEKYPEAKAIADEVGYRDHAPEEHV